MLTSLIRNGKTRLVKKYSVCFPKTTNKSKPTDVETWLFHISFGSVKLIFKDRSNLYWLSIDYRDMCGIFLLVTLQWFTTILPSTFLLHYPLLSYKNRHLQQNELQEYQRNWFDLLEGLKYPTFSKNNVTCATRKFRRKFTINLFLVNNDSLK